MSYPTIILGVIVFLARVTDVTLGTVRTISIVQGRTKIAFMMGFIEVSLWLLVVAKVLQKVAEEPVLTVFYALGFATGNVVGIYFERRLAFGYSVLRVFSPDHEKSMAEQLRNQGYAVTSFIGEGKSGPVTMLYIVCRRKQLQDILSLVKHISPEAFYIVEPASSVSKLYQPYLLETGTGWRAIFKKK
ncbi:DUF2179 domain-containing protein [candidate division KSB1 bacterium]|nr:DUF2179 domain-containing protein [candidate division KSB1 bacterium]